jgi:hypothetical protein
MAFSYTFTIPSAGTENGLGTGRVDHSFTFGASEKIAHFNLDFNFTQFLTGRPTASGFDENQQLAPAFSHVIHGGLQFAGKFYGETQPNQTTPDFASSLWALPYTVVPRLVIDGGFEASLTSGGVGTRVPVQEVWVREYEEVIAPSAAPNRVFISELRVGETVSVFPLAKLTGHANLVPGSQS